MRNSVQDVVRRMRRGRWLLAFAVCLALLIEMTGMGSVALARQFALDGNTLQRGQHNGTGQPKFSLAPASSDPNNPASFSYFVLNAQRGKIARNALRVSNVGNEAGTVSLIAADASTAQTTGLVYASADPVKHNVGSWLALTVQKITLAPGQSQLVPFSVYVPASEAPGQYVGGIIAQSMIQQTSNGSQASNNVQFQVNLIHQQIIAVEVVVQGTLTQQIAATGIRASLSNGNQEMLIDLSNTGNTLVDPQGSLSILNAQGKSILSLKLDLNAMLPGAIVTYPVMIQGQPLATGIYKVVLTLTYGQNHVLNSTATVSITRQEALASLSIASLTSASRFPMWLAILLVIGVAGGLLFVLRGQRVRIAGLARRANGARTRRERR